MEAKEAPPRADSKLSSKGDFSEKDAKPSKEVFDDEPYAEPGSKAGPDDKDSDDIPRPDDEDVRKSGFRMCERERAVPKAYERVTARRAPPVAIG